MWELEKRLLKGLVNFVRWFEKTGTQYGPVRFRRPCLRKVRSPRVAARIEMLASDLAALHLKLSDAWARKELILAAIVELIFLDFSQIFYIAPYKRYQYTN